MANDQDLDSELSRLRNELLNGLKSKQASKHREVNEIVNGNELKSETAEIIDRVATETTSDENDDELERLRIEALNAKRGKNANRKNDRPGRFRYDRESEDDDDDNDDFSFVMLSQRKSSSSENSNAEDDENDKNLKCSDISYESKQENQQTSEHVEITTTTTEQKLDLYEFNNLHRTNYEAYRNECSRLMANETYEPALAPVVAVDLRRLLRDKAMSHHYGRQNQSIEQQQNNYETPITNYSTIDDTDDNNHEFEHESIERDIDVLPPQQRPYRRFYLSKRPPFHSSCHNRGGGCGSRSTVPAAYSRRNKPNGNYPNDDNLINNHNNTEKDDHNDKDNNYDDDDDEKSRKKLKSVVVVKVNYTNSSSWRESTEASSSKSRKGSISNSSSSGNSIVACDRPKRKRSISTSSR